MATKSFSRLPVVMRRTGLGKSSIYAYMAEGKFPQNIKIGDRASAWEDDKIDAWIEARIDASRTE